MKKAEKDTRYAHNASYCMIRPDAAEEDEDVVSTCSS